MSALTKRDEQGGQALACLALELQGEVSAEYARLGQVYDQARDRRFQLEREMDAVGKAAARKLRRELRRMLGGNAWGVEGYAADVRSAVNHAERPETHQAHFTVSFWLPSGSKRLHCPQVTLKGLLIRAPLVMAQFRALAEAAKRYDEVLVESLARPAGMGATDG